MVDTPPFVGIQGARLPVIPEGVLLPVRIELAEHVLESPRHCSRIRFSGRLVVADVLQMLFGTKDIHGARRHVHIAAPDGRIGRREVCPKIPEEAGEPSELVLILRGVDLEALGDIRVDNGRRWAGALEK